MEYDVIVVGSGPAGSSTARAAAEAGASVLVLDKRAEIGAPVQCGEALGKVGMERSLLKPSRKWIAQELDSSCLVGPNGKRVCFENQAYIVERRIFDKHLAIEAARAGAEYRVKTRVTDLIKDNGKVAGVKAESFGETKAYTGKVIVGADGYESRVGRLMGLSKALKFKDAAAGLQYEMVNVELDSPTTEYIYFGNKVAPGGYAWIFPKGDDVANVGIGITVGKDLPQPHNAKYYLDRFVQDNEMTRKATPVNVVAGGIPLSAPVEQTVKENVMLVGDAARQIYSLAGAGMGYSMMCGRIAGEVAAGVAGEEVTEGALMEYDQKWREKYGTELLLAYHLKEIVSEFTDEDLNNLADVILDLGVENLSSLNITQVLAQILLKLNPSLLERLEDFL
jgi:digeranylgeranylglycerophospholipid reductase